MKRVCFRVDYSRSVGGGHLRRCLDLASAFNPKECFFILQGDAEKIEAAFIHEPYRFQILSKTAGFDEQTQTVRAPLDGEKWLIFLDIAHVGTYSDSAGASRFMQTLSDQGHTLAFLDGLGVDSFYSRSSHLPVQFLITPYCGSEKVSGSFTHLFGPEYYILNQLEILKYNFGRTQRIYLETASKILITMGQSDPEEQTALVMKALSAIQMELPSTVEIKVIVGPLFSHSHQSAIKNIAQEGRVQFSLVYSPEHEHLFELFLWSDIAITTAGLTKYELAYCGVPTVIIPHNEMSEKANFAFSQSGTNVTLPKVDLLENGELEQTLLKIVQDAKARQRMSNAGTQLIDGLGTQRIVSAVGAEIR